MEFVVGDTSRRRREGGISKGDAGTHRHAIDAETSQAKQCNLAAMEMARKEYLVMSLVGTENALAANSSPIWRIGNRHITNECGPISQRSVLAFGNVVTLSLPPSQTAVE